MEAYVFASLMYIALGRVGQASVGRWTRSSDIGMATEKNMHYWSLLHITSPFLLLHSTPIVAIKPKRSYADGKMMRRCPQDPRNEYVLLVHYAKFISFFAFASFMDP